MGGLEGQDNVSTKTKHQCNQAYICICTYIYASFKTGFEGERKE
jgi:hypothetical protein